MVEAHYAMNEFRATLRAPDPRPAQYFDGFHDRAPEPVPPAAERLAVLDLEPAGRTGPGQWQVPVDEAIVSVAPTADGYAFWAPGARRFLIWAAARRLLRDLWLARRLEGSAVAFLHASTVDNGTDLVLFVGEKRAGKTSLMLDATLRHGWRIVSNDTLVVWADERGLTACGLPTYLGIRRDVVARFEHLLLPRIAGDAANLGSHAYWTSTPPPADREDKLYLSHGAISRPVFSTIPLAERRVTVAAAGFAPDGTVSMAPLPVDPLTFLLANRKPTGFGLPHLAQRYGEVRSDQGCLAQLAGTARFVSYQHTGDATEILRRTPAGLLSGQR